MILNKKHISTFCPPTTNLEHNREQETFFVLFQTHLFLPAMSFKQTVSKLAQKVLILAAIRSVSWE